VFILLDIISFRMNTYSVVEAALKTRHFISFGMRTYEKLLRNSPGMNTYKKVGGRGASCASETDQISSFNFKLPASNLWQMC
jgi:hypothetical protein